MLESLLEAVCWREWVVVEEAKVGFVWRVSNVGAEQVTG